MPREEDMSKHLITTVTVPFLALILSACAVPRNADSLPATDNGQDTTASLPEVVGSDVDTASQTDDMVDDESSPTVALPPLSFTWNTDYANFLTAPQQVRAAAKEACEARGYETAIMASISLDADSASADFTCHGAVD